MIFSHCHKCGTAYEGAVELFPKTCSSCGHIHYRNPIPVVVCLVPCEEGLLGVVRDIEPQKGWLALPGGFVDMETFEEACSRELLEETGVDLPPSVWEYKSSFLTIHGNILVFYSAKINAISMPQFPFEPPKGVPMETAAIKVIKEGMELAFPSHTVAAELYIKSLKGDER